MAEHDPAMTGFALMNLVRLACVATVVLGMLVLRERLDWPEILGPVLVVVGAAAFFVLPRRVARHWKTPEK